MVDVVRAESRAYQFLEEIGLFIRALRRAESRERSLPVLVADISEPPGRNVQSLFPCCFAKDFTPVVGIDNEVLVLRHTGLSDQRLGEAVSVLDVVKAVTALDAKAARISRPVLA